MNPGRQNPAYRAPLEHVVYARLGTTRVKHIYTPHPLPCAWIGRFNDASTHPVSTSTPPFLLRFLP